MCFLIVRKFLTRKLKMKKIWNILQNFRFQKKEPQIVLLTATLSVALTDCWQNPLCFKNTGDFLFQICFLIVFLLISSQNKKIQGSYWNGPFVKDKILTVDAWGPTLHPIPVWSPDHAGISLFCGHVQNTFWKWRLFNMIWSMFTVSWISTFPSSVSHNHMATSLSMFPHGIVSPSFPDLPLHNASLLLWSVLPALPEISAASRPSLLRNATSVFLFVPSFGPLL